MKFFRVLANILSRWKTTLHRPSYSLSVLTRRALDFSIIFLPAGDRIAGSLLSQQAPQATSSPWSPSCSAPDLHRRVASLPPLSSCVALQLHRRSRVSWASIPAMHSPSANSSSEWTWQRGLWEMLWSLCFRIHCQHSIISLGVMISSCPENCADELQNLGVKRETQKIL